MVIEVEPRLESVARNLEGFHLFFIIDMMIQMFTVQLGIKVGEIKLTTFWYNCVF